MVSIAIVSASKYLHAITLVYVQHYSDVKACDDADAKGDRNVEYYRQKLLGRKPGYPGCKINRA